MSKWQHDDYGNVDPFARSPWSKYKVAALAACVIGAAIYGLYCVGVYL